MNALTEIFYLRAPIRCAFRVDGSDVGFSGQLEVGWRMPADRDQLRIVFQKFIEQIDQRHLALDAPELGVSTPKSLLEVCDRNFSQSGLAPAEIELRRGLDIVYSFRRD